MSSSDDSLNDFEMGDTGEGVVVKVQSSIQQSVFKTHAILEEDSFSMGIDEENMDDWDDDSKAPSIYKKQDSVKSGAKIEETVKVKYYPLFDGRPKIKRKLCNIDERFYKYQEKVKEKVEKMTKTVQEQEIEECTFRPTILNKSKPRSIDEFLEHINKFEDHKRNNLNQKIAKKEEEILASQKSAKPRLCKKSLLIAAKIDKDSEKIVKKSCSFIDLNTYTPKVSQKSKELIRTKRVDKILYEDAVRRKTKSVNLVSVIKENLTSANSQKVLINKFKKEFEQHFSYLDLEETLSINYTKFITLLYNLGFLSRNSSKLSKQKQLALEIWTLIGGTEKNTVHFYNLLTVLTCVMNYKDPSIPTHSLDVNFGSIVEGIYCVRPEEIPKIHKKFRILFEEKNFSKKPSENSFDDSSVEPKKKNNTLHEDKLISNKTKLQEKWEMIRQKKREDEVSLCTFKPKIKRGPKNLSSGSDLSDSNISQYSQYSENKSNILNRNEVLFDYSKLFNQQKLNTSKVILDSESQNEVKNCTFRPKVSKTPKFEEIPEAKGVKEMISRLRNARKTEKVLEKKPFLFGLEKKSEKLSIDLNCSASSIESIKSDISKSFKSDNENLNVQVTMPNGKKNWIRFKSGDNKKKVFSHFIQSNSFKGEAGSKMKSQLKKIFA